MADIKISELEPTTDLEGLFTIGSDKNNLSKKVSLQFLKDAANYANEQGDYAKQAGDTVNGNVGVSDYPEFSASQSYVIGDIVRYNGVLYAFTANHAASAWNGSDVKATSINAITSGKLTELESNVGYQILSGKYDLGLIADKYVTLDGRIADATGWSCTRFLPCKGMKEIHVKDNQKMSGYNCWFDVNMNFISAFDLPYGETNIQVPNNAAYFVLSNDTTIIKLITVFYPIYIDNYIEKGGEVFIFKLTSTGVGNIPVSYNFKKGHLYKINNKSVHTDNAAAYISDGLTRQSISGVGRNKSMTFIAEIDATFYDAYFNNTDINIEIIDLTSDTLSVIAESRRELYEGGKVILTIKDTIAGAGYVSYSADFKKGNRYRVSNNSTKTGLTFNIRKNNLIVQNVVGLGKGGSIEFVALEDGDSIYCYFNNTEVDIEIMLMSATMHDKVDSIINSNEYNKSITDYNKDKITAMKAAVYPPYYSISQYGDGDTPYMPMVMFQTDQHDDFDSINRALAFADEHKEVVCSVSLGDMTTNDLLSKDVATYLFTKSNKPFFRLMGNHEIEVNGNIQQLHETYYNSAIIGKNGENKPSNKLYWYYDINLPSESSKKLRMVGLFQFEKGTNEAFYSMEQLTWFADLLNNTDDNTFVVILSHYNVNTWNKEDAYNEEFTPIPIYRASGYTENGGANSADAIVDAWINGKSITLTIDGVSKTFAFAKAHKQQFFCWISGHHHEDAIFRLSKYPEQINISLDTTCNFQYQCGFGDLPRRMTDKTRDSVTLIGFDWYNRRINIIRLGSDVTKDMRDRKYVSFDLP